VRNFAPRLGLLGAAIRYLRARRALVPFVLAALYVAGIGFHVDRGVGGRPWLLGALSLTLAFYAATPSLPGNGLRDDGTRNVGLLAYALAAFAVVTGSLDSVNPDLSQDLFGGIAAFAGALAASRALVRAQGSHGISGSLPPPPRSLFGMTALMLVVAFGFACITSVRALRDPTSTPLEYLPHDAYAIAAGGSLVVLAGSAWETLRLKRLVVGAGDRLLTAFGVVIAFGCVAIGLLVLGAGAADRVLRLALAGATLSVTYICTEGDAAVLARRGRRAIALLLFGGPLVLLGGLAAQGPGQSVTALLVTGLLALLVGSAIAYLEQPLRRAEGHLLDALDAAHEALVRADPDSSIRDALAALRTFTGVASQSPELWSVAPARVMTVDGAGYTRDRDAVLPPMLLEIAKEEPEATLRTELLEALVVRRPDLRPLTRWMDERGALAATLVTRGGEIEGVLIVPRGGRKATMSLEEVRALKRLGDAFAGASAAHAALSRGLERERLANDKADRALGLVQAYEREGGMFSERDRVLTARLAEGAHGGPYAPVSRIAFDAIERRMARNASVAVVAAHGSDVVSYLARAHLAGPRSTRPFVVVLGASSQEHVLARWKDPNASPLALAGKGLLVLDDAARVPADVQRLLAEVLTQRRAPWNAPHAPPSEMPDAHPPLDVTVALITRTSGAGPSAGARDGVSLDAALASFLEEPLADPVAWPRLRERGEDLRSLVLAELARQGMSVRGAPLGIEDGAYERLADYPYPGEDVELRSILARLALVADGEVVRQADFAKLGPSLFQT